MKFNIGKILKGVAASAQVANEVTTRAVETTDALSTDPIITAIFLLRTAIKNPERAQAVKVEMLELRNAINTIYGQ